MAQTQTDRELVIRLKNGDITALAALDQRYRARIIRIIARLAQSYEEAEDIYQEAILKAFSHIDAFDDKCSFSNWLHRIARNQCIDAYRRKRDLAEPSADVDMLLSVPARERDALDALSDRELLAHIQQAIDALPRRQQSVAKLRLFEGLEYREIAQRIGGSVQAAKSLFSVARKKLGARLQLYLSGFFAFRARELDVGTTPFAGLLSASLHLAFGLMVCYFPIGGQLEKGTSTSGHPGIVLLSNPAHERPRLLAAASSQKTRVARSMPSTLNRLIPPVAMPTLRSRFAVMLTRLTPPETDFPSHGNPLAHDEPAPSGGNIRGEVPVTPAVVQNLRLRYDFSETQVRPNRQLPPIKPGLITETPSTAAPASPEIISHVALPAPTSTQVTLPAISEAFRRLRSFRSVQNLDAYSLAQLRLIARAQGRYPLLISHCGLRELQILLQHGWTPIVVLRSPVGGKHLWAITEWHVHTDRFILVNPLEQRQVQQSTAEFLHAWHTSNAPNTCLLLSTQPLPKPFQLLAVAGDNTEVRVWY